MAMTFELRYADGGDAGSFTTTVPNWNVGDEFRADGNRHYRITAIIPLPLIEEFVENADGELREAWEVEPL